MYLLSVDSLRLSLCWTINLSRSWTREGHTRAVAKSIPYMLIDRTQLRQDAINTVTLWFWLEPVSESKKFVHDFVTDDSGFPDICRASCTHECCPIPKKGTLIRWNGDLDGVHRRVFF